MFNEERKKRYLNSDMFKYDDKTKVVIERVFETLSDTEMQKDKDLSEFIHPQVVDLLKNVNSTSKNYLRLISNICFEYTNWCKIEGYIDRNNINYYDSNITKIIIDDLIPLRMIENKFFTKEYVLDILDKLTDPIDKFLVYAPFCGIVGAACENLKYFKYSDVNQKEKTVKLYDGKTVKVDDLFIELVKGVVLFNESNNDKGNEEYLLNARIKSMSTNNEVSQSFFIFRYKSIQKQVENKFITATNLYKNGSINYVKERFAEKNITLNQAFFELEDKRNYKYSKELKKYLSEYGTSINERMLRKEMREIIELYE